MLYDIPIIIKMSLADQVLLMRQSLENVERELKSLESGKKASAPRARKALQSLKQSSHSLRKQITENVKTMPTKKRVKKENVNVFEAKMEQVEPEQVEPEQVVAPELELEEKKSSIKKLKPKPRGLKKK
jgi:predicted RNA-binding Zn ribbon-like protein